MNTFEAGPKIEKRNHPSEMLRDMLRILSEEINQKAPNEKLSGDLLAPDGSLDPAGYRDLYSEAEIGADAQFVREREVEFSEFYRGKPGIDSEEDMIRKWREDKTRQKSGQMEMAVTLLLSQMLGEDFLVVRTAPYDDYKNGVDNLIVNRTTGEIVGAFDEVHGSMRAESKKAKILKIAQNGGVEIRYGLGFRRNKLKRASLENIPVFYLGLEESELAELISGLAENDAEKKGKIFKKLLGDLVAQQKELQEQAKAIPLRVRLKSFGETLAGIDF